jgi:TonB family protein
MSRAAVVVMLLVFAAPTMRAQPPRFGRVHADSGCVAIRENVDLTAFITVVTKRGEFRIASDSITLAALGDSAAALPGPIPGAGKSLRFASSRLAGFDSAQHATQAMQIVRLTGDSASPYEIGAGNGAWDGAFVIPFDSARALFALMHGPPVATVIGAGCGPDPTPADFARGPPKVRMPELLSGSSVLPYPDSLRSEGTEGKVLLGFIIDTTGRVDAQSVYVIESTHPRFAQAAYAAARKMLFRPAEFDGKKHRLFVRQMFSFTMR